MPPKKYVSITIRREVYERLERLKASLGYSSIGNLLMFLVEFYLNNVGTKEEIGKLVEMYRKCAEEIHSRSSEGG